MSKSGSKRRNPAPIGRRFGNLVVLGDALHTRASWLCRCDCDPNRELTVRPHKLLSGHRKSCGCLSSRFTIAGRSRKHGQAGRSGGISAEYRVWTGILTRCRNPNVKFYARYGGRGITVCDEWAASFQAFFDHAGRRPSPGHQIDRIDNRRGYEPGNVRWATPSEQALNRRSNVMVEFHGEKLPLKVWSQRLGLPFNTLRNRLFVLRWPVDLALTTPRLGKGWRADPDAKRVSAAAAEYRITDGATQEPGTEYGARVRIERRG